MRRLFNIHKYLLRYLTNLNESPTIPNVLRYLRYVEVVYLLILKYRVVDVRKRSAGMLQLAAFNTFTIDF